MLNAEELRKALQRAYRLGQTYWQQADSESLRQYELADKTQAMFDKLVEDTVAAHGVQAGPRVNPACGVHGPLPCEGAQCICTDGVKGLGDAQQ